MPPKGKSIGRSLSQGTLRKINYSAGNQSTVQRRIYARAESCYRYFDQDTDIIYLESLQLVSSPHALTKSTTITPTAQTVINPNVFLQVQLELQQLHMKVIPVGHTTATSINPDTGRTETIIRSNDNFFSNKCFLFTVHKAFEIFDELALMCPTMPDTIPKMIVHFTTNANNDTFLQELVELLHSRDVLFSLMDGDKHPALLDWEETVDDENKTERLFVTVKGIFKDTLNDFKQKDSLANEITILLFAHFYNLKINVIPTRSSPTWNFNQFDPPQSTDRILEVLNWHNFHFDLLIHTNSSTNLTQETTPTLPLNCLSTPTLSTSPSPTTTTPTYTPTPPIQTTNTTTPQNPMQTTAPTTLPTIDTPLLNHPTMPTTINDIPINNHPTPDDHLATITNQSIATESSYTMKPQLPVSLALRLGPTKTTPSTKLPPSNKHALLSQKGKNDISDIRFKERHSGRRRAMRGSSDAPQQKCDNLTNHFQQPYAQSPFLDQHPQLHYPYSPYYHQQQQYNPWYENPHSYSHWHYNQLSQNSYPLAPPNFYSTLGPQPYPLRPPPPPHPNQPYQLNPIQPNQQIQELIKHTVTEILKNGTFPGTNNETSTNN